MADFGKPGSRLSVPFPQDVTAQVRPAAARRQPVPRSGLCPVPAPLTLHAYCAASLSRHPAPAACDHGASCPLHCQQLLGVLRGALALGNPRLAEPALSCMHKLVAYAYLQGETGPSGRLDDDSNIVTQARGRAGLQREQCPCGCMADAAPWHRGIMQPTDRAGMGK